MNFFLTRSQVGTAAYDNFISVYLGAVAAALNISEANIEIPSFSSVSSDASNATSSSKRRSLLVRFFPAHFASFLFLQLISQ